MIILFCLFEKDWVWKYLFIICLNWSHLSFNYKNQQNDFNLNFSVFSISNNWQVPTNFTFQLNIHKIDFNLNMLLCTNGSQQFSTLRNILLMLMSFLWVISYSFNLGVCIHCPRKLMLRWIFSMWSYRQDVQLLKDSNYSFHMP